MNRYAILTSCLISAFILNMPDTSGQAPFVSNFRIMYDANTINPIAPWLNYGSFFLNDIYDLVPDLTIPTDMNILNVSMNDFGSYKVSSVQSWHYGKFFFDGVSDMGIDTGIVLCTGRVAYMEPPSQTDGPGTYCGLPFPASYNSTGPNPGESYLVEPSSGDPNTPFGTHRFAQYPELSTLNNGDSIRDANVLDFDFVPKGDHIRLQYVFASEEYPGNSCTEPNDVMGIFLSGPGITGYQTLSLVPGTNIPVGVNTVNPVGVHCESNQNYSQYYVDNTNGQNVIFDGFTTVLTAWTAVNPCDTYHLRIAVADGAWHEGACDTLPEYPGAEDSHCMGLYDSGIFLKQHSFRSTDSLRVEARGGVAGDTLAPYAVRGCLPGSFRLYRLRPDPFPLELHYSLAGSAVNGTDYSMLSGMATIPANTSFVDVPVDALLPGGAAAGPKTVKLILQSPYSSCTTMALPDADSAVLTIYEALYAQIPQTDTTICTGCSTEILVEGDPALQYSWTPVTGLDNATLQNPVATPPQSSQYFMTATAPPPGSCPPVQDSIYVYVGNVGMEHADPARHISIYPNPFRESFRIISPETDNRHTYRISLTHLRGRKLLSLQGSLSSLNQELEHAGSALAPGHYWITITDEQTKAQSVFKLAKVE